jgi:ABC-2 type transport system permease protein
MWHRIAYLIVKDLQQFLRDRVLFIFVLVGPTLLLMLMGHSTSTDIEHLPTAVVDEDHTRESRDLIASLENLSALSVTVHSQSVDEVSKLLDRGEVTAAVHILKGFSADLSSPDRKATVQLLVDGSNILGAYTALAAAQGAMTQFGEDVAIETRKLEGTASRLASPLELRPTAYYNPDLTYSYYLLPSQLSLIVLIITLLVSSVGIVRERERGTLELLMVTPLSRIELIAAKAVLPALVSTVGFGAMLAIVAWLFHVPVRGSLPLLLGVTLIFVLAQLTWGLIISSVSATQQQAILLIFMIGILNVAFSGYLVAVENMPTVMQWVSAFFPISHYLIMLRAVMIKGASLVDIQRQLLALIALGAASTVVSVRSFEKRLE